MNLVNAQQARRILDRIVGFELSPVLWKKVKPALSAGRVQSVAVRLIVEREREVHAFVSEPSYRVTAVFEVPDVDGNEVEVKAELSNRFKTKEEAQAFLETCKDAQFSIEDITTRPVKKSPEQKLYELIWKRTIASQMADAELEKTTATIVISNSSEKFIATGEVITFDGFLRVYKESYDDDNEQEDEGRLLPPLSKGEKLIRKEILATQRFTQCPPRYTEASLVRKLEELGIGRPSTYAPTISTVQQRGYVEKGNSEGVKRPYDILKLKGGKITETTKTEMTGNEKAKLLPTDTGIVVNDFLMEYFPEIMDFNFTANVEKEFDEVAEGEKEWTGMMDSFYKGFHPLVDKTIHSKTEHKVGERVLGTDPVSGKPVSVKIGRFGPVIQIGTADDEEKPRFAQLTKGLSMETITLEEALDAFKLPRTLGDYDGHTVTVGVGRFGPYVRYDNLFLFLKERIRWRFLWMRR